MREARPSDWFIAGLFFTLGAMGALALVGCVVGLGFLLMTRHQ
jgi:hypothetical protein